MSRCAREKQGYVAYYMDTSYQEQAQGLPTVSSQLWYCNKVLDFSTAHARKTVKVIYSGTTVQFRLWGTQSSERAIISDTTIASQTLAANGDPPPTNTCRGCTSSRKQPSLSKHHPLQEQGRVRVGFQTVTGSYELLLQQYYSGVT